VAYIYGMSQFTQTFSQPLVSRKRMASIAGGRAKKPRTSRRKSIFAVDRIQKSVGFPRSKFVTMKYFLNTNVSWAAGAMGAQIMSCNSIYDPDRTSTGHQPSNYDTWSTLYDHYCVLSSSIKVTASCQTITGVVPVIWGVAVNDNTTPASASDPSTMIENGSKYRMLPAYQSVSQTMTEKFNASRWFGNAKPSDNREIGALFGANPSDEAFFYIWATAANASASGANVFFNIEVNYNVLVQEPKDFVQS